MVNGEWKKRFFTIHVSRFTIHVFYLSWRDNRMELIYEKSVPGRKGVKLPSSDVPSASALPEGLLRTESAGLAEVSELALVRHFTNLSRRNFSVDTNFYPL